MRAARVALHAALLGSLLAVGACGRNEDGSTPLSRSSPVVTSSSLPTERLSAQNLRMYLTVRNRALQRLEDALADKEQVGTDTLTRVKELGAAEREAAEGLGVEWRVYAGVRDHIGRLLTAQRQREDRALLGAELSRAQQELSAQLGEAHDQASRQFLEAQINGLSQQLERLKKEQVQSPRELDELRVLESGRAEIALLQGRYERIQKRLQDILGHVVTPGPATGSKEKLTAK